MKNRLRNVDMIRKENIEILKMKEKRIIRENYESSPGPGAYEVKWDCIEEKNPYVSIFIYF